MHLPKSKPKPANWKVVLTSPILLAALLFPISAYAVDETSTPTDSPSASASPNPSASPEPTQIPLDPSIYNSTAAASIQVVVNKKNPLNPKTYAPVLSTTTNLAAPAARAYRKLKAAVFENNLGTLCLNSGYRSYLTQKKTHAYQVARGKQYGYDGETVAARPGYSEHQTGLAADVSITSLSCRITNFGTSKASKWISANAWKYGFVIRYPKGKQAITGYIWEPWHLRYVGPKMAADMKLKKISTLEEYFSLPPAPKY